MYTNSCIITNYLLQVHIVIFRDKLMENFLISANYIMAKKVDSGIRLPRFKSQCCCKFCDLGQVPWLTYASVYFYFLFGGKFSFFYLCFFYCCSSTVVSISPSTAPTPAFPTSLPQSYPPCLVHVSFTHVPWQPFPLFLPLSPPTSHLVIIT